MLRVLSLVVLLAFAAACGDSADIVTSDDPGGDGSTRPSVAGEWILRSLTVDDATITLPAGELDMTIDSGEISGNLGCNSFFAQIDAADDGTLGIDGLGSTAMACVEQARMDFEFTYALALGVVTSWTVDPAGLTLSGDTAGIRYEQAPPPVHRPLEGTVWHFDTVYSGEGPDRTASNSADMEGVTLVITDGQAVMAGPGCVDWRGDAEFDQATNGAFALGAYGGIEPASCDVVARAMRALAESTGFMIDENRLTFIGDAGETVGFSARG